MLSWIIGISVFLVLSLYVIAPLIIKGQLRMPRTIGEANVPPEATAYVRRIATNLKDEGFVPSRIYFVPGPSGGLVTFCALLVSRPMMITALASVTFEGTRVKLEYTEFYSITNDRRAVLTNNSPELSAFVTQPDRDVLHLPGVSSPSVLFQLHLERVNRLLGSQPALVVPPPGDEPRFIVDAIEHSLAYQRQCGILRDAGDSYVLTLWGAYRLTWAELPPFKQLRVMRMRSRARRAMQALGFDPRSAV